MTTRNDIKEIWSWSEDKWRVGEMGFKMLSDEEMIFSKYPYVYHMRKGEEPTIYFDFPYPIIKTRAVEKGEFLLIGETSCWLVDVQGRIIQQWENLLRPEVQNAPLNRNQIFDADYRDGQLLLAYWGQSNLRYHR